MARLSTSALAAILAFGAAHEAGAQAGADGPAPGAYLGTQIRSAPQDSSAAAPGGAEIVGIVPNSPAAVAGLKPGEIIESIDGHLVGTPLDVVARIGRHAPGDRVILLIVNPTLGPTPQLVTAVLAAPRSSVAAAPASAVPQSAGPQ